MVWTIVEWQAGQADVIDLPAIDSVGTVRYGTNYRQTAYYLDEGRKGGTTPMRGIGSVSRRLSPHAFDVNAI